MRTARRLVASNDAFVALLPFFGRFPTELQIYSRRHFQSLADLDDRDADSLRRS